MNIPKIPFKVENRLLSILTILATVIAMNFLFIKPMKADFRRDKKELYDVIIEIASIERFSIQNSYRIDKIKHNSTVILQADNDMNVQQVTKTFDAKIDSLKKIAASYKEDIPRKTFWERIKFW